jgi:hypothetical protein
MDITDVIGDREAGVRTIPVVAGQTIHPTCQPASTAPPNDLLRHCMLCPAHGGCVSAGRTAALAVAAMCIASSGSLLAYTALHGHGLAWAVSTMLDVQHCVIFAA